VCFTIEKIINEWTNNLQFNIQFIDIVERNQWAITSWGTIDSMQPKSTINSKGYQTYKHQYIFFSSGCMPSITTRRNGKQAVIDEIQCCWAKFDIQFAYIFLQFKIEHVTETVIFLCFYSMVDITCLSKSIYKIENGRETVCCFDCRSRSPIKVRVIGLIPT
jgi:hypothetical protein